MRFPRRDWVLLEIGRDFRRGTRRKNRPIFVRLKEVDLEETWGTKGREGR